MSTTLLAILIIAIVIFIIVFISPIVTFICFILKPITLLIGLIFKPLKNAFRSLSSAKQEQKRNQ